MMYFFYFQDPFGESKGKFLYKELLIKLKTTHDRLSAKWATMSSGESSDVSPMEH
jgi:hypothetical protein